MGKLSRIECESAILRKMKEIIDIYHEYDPDGDYISLYMLDNKTIHVNNDSYEDGKTINCFISDRNENNAIGTVFEGGNLIRHYIEFDIRDASLVSGD